MHSPITDPRILEAYLTDASNLHGHADGLFRPETTEEVAQIMAYCQEHGQPITVTASRTSTTGAPVPFGGWLLSMERMSGILRISEDEVEVQGGALLGEVQRQCEALGRLLPPDPTSRHECTVGAAIACNASGARAFKYGPTRPWVTAVTAVLPDGSIVEADRTTPIPKDWPIPRWTEPKVKTAAGYVPADNLLDLLIGQEGTLAIITQARLKLTELPHQVLGFLAYFPSREAAVQFVDRARTAARDNPSGPITPRALEYLDHHCLTYAQERVGAVPESATCALFCEQEVGDLGEDAHTEAWWEALSEIAGDLADETIITDSDAARAKLHELRHAVPAGINETVIRNGMPKVGTDLAVPDAHLNEVMALYESCPLPHATFGHIGDNHLHCNVLPTTAEELEAAKSWYRTLAYEVIRMGGTVSAEHGIGKLKRELLAEMVGPEVVAQFQSLKLHLDPQWILGRGTMVNANENLAAVV